MKNMFTSACKHSMLRWNARRIKTIPRTHIVPLLLSEHTDHVDQEAKHDRLPSGIILQLVCPIFHKK